MKIFQNRLFVGGACIALSAVIAFAVVPIINKSKSNTETVIKVKADVLAGTKLEEDMLVETEVGSYGLPENVIKKKEDVIGKFANCTIKTEDFIVLSKISDYAANEKLDKIAAEGKKLITVTVSSLAAGVGNHLRAGDYVSVLMYDDNSVEAFEELKSIEIYSIENSDAISIEDAEESDAGLSATVTLIVNDAQAQKLVYSEYAGKLHIVFERRGVNA